MNTKNNKSKDDDERFLSKIRQGSGVSILRYYAQNFSKFYMDIHWHKAAEIMYVLKGKCKIEYMDCKVHIPEWGYIAEDKRESHNMGVDIVEVEMKQGQLVFFDSKVPHSMNIDGSECKILCIEMAIAEDVKKTKQPDLKDFPSFDLHADLQEDDNFAMLARKNLNYIFMQDEAQVYGSIKDVQRELSITQNDKTKNMMAGMMLTKFFVELARAYKVHVSGNESVNMYVKKAVKYINENFDTEFVVEDIAEKCNIHENYLQRVFKNVTGESIVKYTNRLRMEKAEMLLLNSDMSIVDIAESVGFNSRQHFGHVFRQHNGMNPNKFRQIGGIRGEVKLVDN